MQSRTYDKENSSHLPRGLGSDEQTHLPREEPDPVGAIVVKIGGNTFEGHDTTLRDLVALQNQGMNPVVIHGGGKTISRWMEMQGVRPRFIKGLRVTDSRSLEIVVAVLAGLINKSIVASIMALGGRAIGISGADGGMLQARMAKSDLGLVGEISKVDTKPLKAVIAAGAMPVIAPIAAHYSDGQATEPLLLNVNADTAAGEIAHALKADQFVVLTDVEGVLDSNRRLIPRLTRKQAESLMRSNIVEGGMIPKLEACVTALGCVDVTQIIDGRKPDALIDTVSGEQIGTRVG